MISDQSHHCLQSVLVISQLSVCYSVHAHTQSKVCSCGVSLSPSEKPTWHSTKIDNQERELTAKDESVPKK